MRSFILGVRFRLLTEYHSFLCYKFKILNNLDKLQGFRLLTEYHSFLYDYSKTTSKFRNLFLFPSPYGVSFILIVKKLAKQSGLDFEFPSPYGVSFILIGSQYTFTTPQEVACFRLLTEYHSFLYFL